MTKTHMRLVALCTLIAIFIPVLSAHAPQHLLATEVYVDPTTISAPIGTQFTLTVGITDVVDLSGFGIQLGWNSTVLDYVSHTPTPENVLNTTGGAITFTVMDTVDAAAGTYQLAVATLPASGFTGSGTMFNLTLEVLAVGVSNLEFLLHDLSDLFATPIDHTAVNGTFDNQGAVVQYDLTITVTGNGTTDPAVGSYLYDEGTIVPVTATPDSGWELDHWLLDTADVGAANPYNVTMNSNHTLEAVFTEIPPELPTLFSTDDTGTEKNEFNTTDPVYVSGAGFTPDEELKVYIVPNGSPFTSAASIFNKTAQANGSGVLLPVQLGLFDVGEYDVWIDRNANGELDPATEPVDDFDMEISGIIVIPEFVAGITLGFAVCLAALSILCIRKRKTN
jgi:hypothetical protein